ncbi:Iron transport multicopper oxidase FET3 [Spathaspora sp. JA1]|nr:Iron transport multicopper oxidase FET3 [Spathaspora sp. JA1]
MKFIPILLISFFWSLTNAKTHTWWYETTWVNVNADGHKNRPMIGFNGTWPPPTLRIKKGDTVNLYLTNGLPDVNTTLHFHGLFQRGTNQMDGPEMVTQCPIVPGATYLYNFTVTEQVGTFWYHSHSLAQTGDGFRGAFIIEDDDFPYEYDEEVVLTVSELYYDRTVDLVSSFMSRFNPTGAEPIPDNFLFNDTVGFKWKVEPNKTYFVRILNVGGFLSHYLWMKDHEFTVIEADGNLVEKKTTDILYISVGQRYGVLITTKNQTDTNYPLMDRIDVDMLDIIPNNLPWNATNYLIYNEDAPLPEKYLPDSIDDFLDDLTLRPLTKDPLLDDPDYVITLDIVMDNLGNGVNYAFFNNITYVHAKVPSLLTALSAGEFASNSLVYGSNTNAFVLQPNDVVDVVLNNLDSGRHPFHLHGHVFQLLERHEEIPEGQDPARFNTSDHAEWPEYPMHRDTAICEPYSYLVIRFKANNPGVWMFHCHAEWHLDQGLAAVFIEDPMGIQKEPLQQITESNKQVCEKAGMPWEGNAAGNKENFLDLYGENVQAARLPTGFTTKGIVALAFSAFAGLLGIATIAVYGMTEVTDDSLKDILSDVSDLEMEEDGATQNVEDGTTENLEEGATQNVEGGSSSSPGIQAR